MNDRIYRTREDRMFLGVLGGFSLRFGIDPSIVRIAYAIITLFTGIVPLVILYIVMAIVIPEAPPGYEAAARTSSAAGAPPPTWAAAPPPSTPSSWPSAGPTMPVAPAAPSAPAAAAETVAAADAAGSGPSGWAAAPGAPGPTPAWGAGWDPSGRPTSGETEQHARDARTGAIVGGLVLLGLGGAFLAAQVAPQLDWGIVGPVLLIALGVVLVLASFRRA